MARKKQKRQMSSEAKPLPPVKNVKLMSLDVEDTPDLTHFFRREDWVAAVATFVLTTLTFLHHLAPEVTLQDSGELVTGAFNLGVPHPPGYPLWACLGYIWSHVIVPFGNPAWRIGTMSSVTGGLVVGVMTLMMTRSIRILLHSLPWTEAVDEKLNEKLRIHSAASATARPAPISTTLSVVRMRCVVPSWKRITVSMSISGLPP